MVGFIVAILVLVFVDRDSIPPDEATGTRRFRNRVIDYAPMTVLAEHLEPFRGSLSNNFHCRPSAMLKVFSAAIGSTAGSVAVSSGV
jgi:hypothetical protein